MTEHMSREEALKIIEKKKRKSKGLKMSLKRGFSAKDAGKK